MHSSDAPAYLADPPMLLKLTGGALQSKLEELLAPVTKRLDQAQVIEVPQLLDIQGLLGHSLPSEVPASSRATKRVFTGSL